MAIVLNRAGQLAPELDYTFKSVERELNALETRLTASGTAFPSELREGLFFYRTDENLEYIYDGTRWLTTQLFTLQFLGQDALFPLTATTTLRAPNPFAGQRSVYVESGTLNALVSTVTATTYFTCVIRYEPGADPAVALTSNLSTQNITANTWTAISDDVDTVVPSTANVFHMLCTETGTCSAHLMGSIQYRLIG